MASELSGLIEGLSAQGEHHSQGVWTTDARRALQLLSERLFHEPAAWLAKWVQAGYLAGATRLECRPAKDRLTLTWHGLIRALEPQALEAAWTQPLETADRHVLRPLALCLHALRFGLADPARAELVVGLQRWALTSGGLEALSPLSTEAGPTSLSLTLQRAGGWQAEKSLLERRCCLSPLLIEWNGKPLNGSPPGVPHSKEQRRFDYLLDKLYLSTEPARELLTLPHLTALPAAVYDTGGTYQDTYSYGPTWMQLWRCYTPRHSLPLFDSVPPPGQRVQESTFVQELFGLPQGAYALNHGRVRPGRLEGINNGYQILYVSSLEPQTRAAFELPQGRFGRSAPPAARAWLRCPALPAGPGSLHLQSQGVLLDPLPVDWPLAGAAVLLADEQTETDLSGLTPVRNQRTEQLIEWFRDDLTRSKTHLRKALRWHDKFGVRETEVQRLYQVHNLAQDALL